MGNSAGALTPIPTGKKLQAENIRSTPYLHFKTTKNKTEQTAPSYFYEGRHDDGKIEAATLCLWRNHSSTATNFSTSSSDVAQLVANLTIVRPSAAFSQKLNSTV